MFNKICLNFSSFVGILSINHAHLSRVLMAVQKLKEMAMNIIRLNRSFLVRNAVRHTVMPQVGVNVLSRRFWRRT